MMLSREAEQTELATLPRVRVNSKFILPVADTPLWQTVPLADDRSTWRPAWWFVGAHGGAGVSSLADMMAPAGDAGRLLPAVDSSNYVVVVCRASSQGIEAAHNVALQVLGGQAGGCKLIGVVVVADAPGKLAKKLKNRLRVLGEITCVWQVPYLPQLVVQDRDDNAELELRSWAPDADGLALGRGGKPRVKVDLTEYVHPDIARVAEAIFAQCIEYERGGVPRVCNSDDTSTEREN